MLRLRSGAVADPGVGPVAVAVDVGADLAAGLVDGLPCGAPGAAALELAEPGLDERLGLRIPVAATAVSDPPGGQVPAEVP